MPDDAPVTTTRPLDFDFTFFFAMCGVLRLARFNVANDEEKPKWQSNYFIGMPTPAAAIVVSLPGMASSLVAQPIELTLLLAAVT